MKIFSPTDNSSLAVYWPRLRFLTRGTNKGVGAYAETCFVVQRDEKLKSWLIIVRVLGFGLGLSWWKKEFDF